MELADTTVHPSTTILHYENNPNADNDNANIDAFKRELQDRSFDVGDDDDPEMSKALRASLEDSGIGQHQTSSRQSPAPQFRPSDRAPDPNWAMVSTQVRSYPHNICMRPTVDRCEDTNWRFSRGAVP